MTWFIIYLIVIFSIQLLAAMINLIKDDQSSETTPFGQFLRGVFAMATIAGLVVWCL